MEEDGKNEYMNKENDVDAPISDGSEFNVELDHTESVVSVEENSTNNTNNTSLQKAPEKEIVEIIQKEKQPKPTQSVYVTTEMLFQMLCTYLFCLLLFLTEYVLNESLYLNKTLVAITFLWTYIPSLLMYIKIRRYKLELLCLVLLVEFGLLGVLYHLRNRFYYIVQTHKNVFTEKQLEEALKILKSVPSCGLIFVSPSARKRFLIAMNNHSSYKDAFLKYFCKSEKFVYKFTHLLNQQKFDSLSGLNWKFLFVYETDETWYNNSGLIKKITQ